MYIESLVLSLPRAEEHETDNLKGSFDEFKDGLDDQIEMFFGSEALPEELAGVMGDKTVAFKDALKNTLLRKWMSDNNYMPEILKATSLDADGNPMLDIYGEFTQYAENMSLIMEAFIKGTGKVIKKSDKKLNKLDDDDEEYEPSGDEETDNNDPDNSDAGDDSTDTDDSTTDDDANSDDADASTNSDVAEPSFDDGGDSGDDSDNKEDRDDDSTNSDIEEPSF